MILKTDDDAMVFDTLRVSKEGPTLEVNIPNHAIAIVITSEVIDAISICSEPYESVRSAGLTLCEPREELTCQT